MANVSTRNARLDATKAVAGARKNIEILEGSSAEDHSERRGVKTTYPAHMTPQDTSDVPASQAS